MRQVQLTLEGDMQLLCVTGVEDKLQPDVRTSLELLANAGIKVISVFSFQINNLFSNSSEKCYELISMLSCQ